MHALKSTKTWMVFLLTVGFLGLFVTEITREIPPMGVPRSEPMRGNLPHLRKILLTLERELGALPEVQDSERVALMQSAVGLLKECLLPHLAAEEEVLYPAVDRELRGSSVSPTQAMKEEHDIMRRWIRQMELIAVASLPDPNAFARRGERLLGLLEAHFDVEEAVLFPVLDQAMPLTEVEFKEGP
jgi:hemerythrin-like domain-containing protein